MRAITSIYSGMKTCERSALTKVRQLLDNACLSPTTLASKGSFPPRGPRWVRWFSLFSEEPHRVNSNDLVGALGAGPRPGGVGEPGRMVGDGRVTGGWG